MATSTTRLMSFEEFEKLPDHPGGRYELYHGEAIFVPPPKYGHNLIQLRLLSLLGRAAGNTGVVTMEMGFRPRPDHEYWIADVAFVEKTRSDAIPRDGYPMGAPELVIEVLSPSNTVAKMNDRRKTCLANGSVEFWAVDINLRQVAVSTRDGQTITYKAGQTIPLLFGGQIAVDEIFA